MLRVAAFGLALLTALPALAQPACTLRDEVLKQLKTRFSESPVAFGLANNGSVVEVLANEQGATWTIIITTPSGVSCLIAAGEGWESMPQLASSGTGS